MTIKVTSSEWQAAPSPVTRPLCAVGDLHGCADLLAALRGHLAREPQPGAHRVYLGDLIDPHPRREHAHDCADVVNQVALDMRDGAEVLCGNHDAFLLIARACAAGEPPPWPDGVWYEQGGAETAAAWGFEVVRGGVPFEPDLARAVWSKMSAAQRAVFESMKVHVEHDRYLLVHAGFHPSMPLEKQFAQADIYRYPTDRDEAFHPLWMRFKPGTDAAPRGRVLIHGHMSTRRPFIGRKRISIDTGAKYGGPLTALEIVGDRLRLHQAWPAETDPARWAKDGMR
jgi:serine/threonine protein phosphatase 1